MEKRGYGIDRNIQCGGGHECVFEAFLDRRTDRKVCGLFGYTAFDAVRYFENIPVMEAHHEENDAPDMLYILYKYVLVFNHFKMN